MSRVMHFEIQATEPARLIAFYQALFGWKIQQWGDQPYWLIETEPGAVGGGILPRRGPAPLDGTAVNCFVCTMRVEALDTAFARALELGASVAVGKMPIPGVGWLAYVKDPDGNIFGMMQEDKHAA